VKTGTELDVHKQLKSQAQHQIRTSMILVSKTVLKTTRFLGALTWRKTLEGCLLAAGNST
jgi:hypothetical protein